MDTKNNQDAMREMLGDPEKGTGIYEPGVASPETIEGLERIASSGIQEMPNQIKPKPVTDDGLCAQAYEDYFHKIKADIAFDRWRALWGFIKRRIVTEDMLRHADLGASVERNGCVPDEQHEVVFLKLRRDVVNDGLLANLQRLAETINSGTQVVVSVGEEAATRLAIADLIREKFASGNDVPVERITLTRAEVGLGAAGVQP